MLRQHPWLLPLLLAVFVLGGWYFGHRAAKADDRELPVYVTGGERMARGEEIYRRGTDGKPFTYPPFAAVPFVPFVLLPADWRPAAWFAINFALLLLIGRWLHGWGRREDPGRGPPRLVRYWVLTLVFGGHHVLSVLSNQSHDLLVAGTVGLTAAAWCRGSPLAGGWAGLGGALKATPLLFAGLFVLRWRPFALALLAAGFAAASLLPDWLFPRSDGRWWLQAWYEVNLRGLEVGGTANAPGAWNPHSYLNQSLSGTLTRLLTPAAAPGPFVDERAVLLRLSPGAFRCASWAAQLAVLLLIAVAVRGGARTVAAAADRRAAQRTVGLGEVAAVACGMVLLSPQSSKAHFCVWLFPAAFLAEVVLRGRRDVGLWLLLGCALLLGPLAAKDLLGKALGNQLLAYGNVTWCTLILLLAVARALRAGAGAAPPAASPP